MNFFQSQENARRRTGWLVALFVLAVIGLIALTQLLVMFSLGYGNISSVTQNGWLWKNFSWQTLGIITGVITTVVTLASLFKMRQLSAGGSVIAEMLGGTPLERISADLHEQKILNVVEEMAIAAGVPVPPVYILEEASINAFAAGHDSRDVVIGITRGAIQLLSRDELQGVIAHEFSHIFNGDMKMNLHLMGWLHGILFIGLVGRFLLDSRTNNSNKVTIYRSSSRRSKDTASLALLGIGLIIIGYIGTFFGKLIKAAISRQREFLADASAVQYTRNPDGIAGALKKIGGCHAGSLITHPNASQASHLFFGNGVRALTSLFATHPPLADRIRAIEPRWNGEFSAVDSGTVDIDKPAIDPSQVEIVNGEIRYTPNTATIPITAANVIAAIDNIGAPQPEHLTEARQRLADIPDWLKKMAHETWGASAIAHCLLVDRNSNDDSQQLSLLQQHAPGSISSLCERIIDSVKQLPYALRLPLLDLCLPSLKLLTTPQREQFFRVVITQIQMDKTVSLFEWSLYRILRHHLDPQKNTRNTLSLQAVADSCRTVLSALSLSTHAIENVDAHFLAAWQQLGLTAASCDSSALANTAALDKAVQQLQHLQALAKPRLLKACCTAIMDDQQQYSAAAVEILRAIADTLDAPIPPTVSTTARA